MNFLRRISLSQWIIVSLVVGVALDGVRTRVRRGPLERLVLYVLRAEKVRDALLSITLVSACGIAKLNEAYLGHAGPTDVMAFGLRGRGTAQRASAAAAVV